MKGFRIIIYANTRISIIKENPMYISHKFQVSNYHLDHTLETSHFLCMKIIVLIVV